MKTLLNFLILILLVVTNTSCLKSGLDELETFDQNDITNVRFEYRWWDEADKRMRVIEMNVDKTFDNDKKEIFCSINVPTANNSFTAAIREQVSLQTLAINVDASTAVRITPVGNAPQMGTFPADFSAKEFTYKVTAGNGNEANWTISISDFRK